MQNTWLENRIIKKLAKFLLPAVTAEDIGKTVVVDSSGAWSIGESGGGGGGGSDSVVNLYVDMEHGIFNKDDSTNTINFLFPILDKTGVSISFNDVKQLLSEKIIKINMQGLRYNISSSSLIVDDSQYFSDIVVYYAADDLEGDVMQGVIKRTLPNADNVTTGYLDLYYLSDPINETGKIYCTGAYKHLGSS